MAGNVGISYKSKEGYMRYLDLAKGFAMLLVIADHCGIGLCPVFDYFEVPIFFLVSGILFSYNESFVSFLRKKSLRLVVPYFVYTLLFIAVCMPFGYQVPTFKRFIFDILYTANYPLWFFKSLFWALLLTWLMHHVGLFKSIKRYFVALLISVVCGLGVYYFSFGHWGILMISGLPQAITMIPIMVLGCMIRKFLPWFGCISRTKRYMLSTLLIILAH